MKGHGFDDLELRRLRTPEHLSRLPWPSAFIAFAWLHWVNMFCKMGSTQRSTEPITVI